MWCCFVIKCEENGKKNAKKIGMKIAMCIELVCCDKDHNPEASGWQQR